VIRVKALMGENSDRYYGSSLFISIFPDDGNEE